MTTAWDIFIAINLCCYVWIWQKSRHRGVIFWSQSVCIFFTLAKVSGFYAYRAHWIIKPIYHWIAWLGDVSTSIGDITVAIVILFGTGFLYKASTLEAATVISILLHQRIKIEWHWVAEIFRNLPQEEVLLHYSSIISNYSTLVLLCILVAAHPAHKEYNNEQRESSL